MSKLHLTPDFAAIVAPSGSGKTTFLNIISGLDKPTDWEVFLKGRSLFEMSGGEISDFRRDHIGFIFQAYNLIPVLSARENIEYVMLLQGVPRKERDERVRTILKEGTWRGTRTASPPGSRAASSSAYLAIGGTYQLHPLAPISATILHNLTDHSLSVSPGIDYNIAEDIYLAAGATLGIGKRPFRETPSADPLPRSEFGAYPDMYWASFRIYF